MKTRLLLMIVLLGVCASVAQEGPIPPRRSRAVKVGLFAGYTPGYLFVDTAPINEFLVANQGAALSDGGVYLNGGAGAIYIMVLANVRVGFMGMGGSTSSTSLVGNVRRDAKLGVGLAGPTFEYVIPLSEKLDVALGGLIGWGSTTLTLKQDQGGTKSWGTEWTRFGSGNYQSGGQIADITRTMNGNFFVLQPAINIEYAPLGWLAIRLGASYLTMLAPSWNLDNTYDLVGVPSSVKGQGFMINGGILLGTF
jgi:hypothetical protein